MPSFEIDPDIRKARTLPSEFYTDGRFFELSKEKIFARSWQFLGTANEKENLVPVSILDGFLDIPVLISRSENNVSCLSNVCTHRGKILVEKACSAKLIRCGYHGRRFSLDGKFLSMPEFEDVEDFPFESDNLHKIPLAIWGKFLFASIDPAADFSDYLEGVFHEFDAETSGSLDLVSQTDYEINAHWALYCENYLEGFHIPYVHRGLNEIIDYGTYTTELFRYSSVQTAFDDAGNVAARYLFIFPNLMFNFYPWGVSVNIVKPVNPGRSTVTFLTYVSDPSMQEKGAGADLHSVELEDEAVVESVQKGIRSRFYTHGRYSPTREQGTHHFHRLIAEFMRWILC